MANCSSSSVAHPFTCSWQWIDMGNDQLDCPLFTPLRHDHISFHSSFSLVTATRSLSSRVWAVDPASRLGSPVSFPKDSQPGLNRLFGVVLLAHPPTFYPILGLCTPSCGLIEDVSIWRSTTFVGPVIRWNSWTSDKSGAVLFFFDYSITRLLKGIMRRSAVRLIQFWWFHYLPGFIFHPELSDCFYLYLLPRDSPWSGPMMPFRWPCFILSCLHAFYWSWTYRRTCLLSPESTLYLRANSEQPMSFLICLGRITQ